MSTHVSYYIIMVAFLHTIIPFSTCYLSSRLSILPTSIPATVYLRSYTMSRLKWLSHQATVAHEPGLTNAQLQLTNDDLRPGEPATEAE